MCRWLSYMFSVFCVLLATATGALWAASYVPSWRYNALCVRLVEDEYLALSSMDGVLKYEYISCDPPDSPRGWRTWQCWAAKTVDGERVTVACPHWFVTLLLCLVTLSAFGFARRQRRLYYRARHLCEKCGYDLRATPDRCPECGTAPPGRPDSPL